MNGKRHLGTWRNLRHYIFTTRKGGATYELTVIRTCKYIMKLEFYFLTGKPMPFIVKYTFRTKAFPRVTKINIWKYVRYSAD